MNDARLLLKVWRRWHDVDGAIRFLEDALRQAHDEERDRRLGQSRRSRKSRPASKRRSP
jgi:predicted metalloendopeptidase